MSLAIARHLVARNRPDVDARHVEAQARRLGTRDLDAAIDAVDEEGRDLSDDLAREYGLMGDG
jgi:hypothetical protein